jgi:hypothetical protein
MLNDSNPAADAMVAMDAYLAGDIAAANKILAGRIGLGRAQAKKIARVLTTQGRLAEAMLVLTRTMGHDGALSELGDAPRAQVGDILVCSWGYDQTNVDYYEVVAVKGSTCTIREIGARVVDGGRGSERVAPVAGAFIGEPMTGKRVQKTYGGGYCVKVDDHHASQWDGQPEHRTASGYGH